MNEMKTKSYPRRDKPFIPFSRNSGNYSRRPFSRRRMASRRYNNMGVRPFRPPMHRPECPMPRGAPPNFRHPSIQNTAIGRTPTVLQRPPRPLFPCVASKNFDNRTNQFPLPPSNANENFSPLLPNPCINYTGSQTSVESPEQRNHPNEQNFSELWVEALAPRGRRYYYNARTRESTWNKPMNVRVIALDEINRLTPCSNVNSGAQGPRRENRNHFVQHQPNNSYNNSLLPRNFAMAPPRLMMFPPPQNICPRPQIFFASSTEHVKDAFSYFNPAIPPPVFPLPIVARNLVPSTEIADYNVNETYGEISNDSEQIEYQDFIENEESNINQTENSDCNIPDHNISLCTSVNEINDSEEVEESTPQDDIEELANFESENKDLESPELEHYNVTEKECPSSEEPVESKNEYQHVDKSRPVSSTPVSDTCWCVVWTGDNKVFFYNSQRKVSVWERPTELKNRKDVDKLISKSPYPMYMTMRKEVRKITSVGSDITKKFKIKEESSEDSGVEENSESNDIHAVENTPKEEIKPNTPEVSHEQKVKMFREMLADNKISVYSTWEKELHKIVFDSRYLLLPSNERRLVFDSYIHKKVEEDKNDRQKEHNYNRERFISLLEEAGITWKSQFSDIARRYANDVRFKALEKIKQKESIFNEYVSDLMKKERENEKLRAEQKKKFIELLREQKCLNKDWSVVKKTIADDERYKTIENESFKEKIFTEYIESCPTNIAQNEKKKRISMSIRNREEEVKKNLSMHLKDREREQEFHKLTSAVSNFKALLEDLIRTSDVSWNSAKKFMKADKRWDFAQCLDPEKREKLFSEHIDSINCKKRDQFHRLLDEMSEITLKTSWLDVRKSVLNDPRCKKFSSNERKCEKEFKEYLRTKSLAAKMEFRELLKETKLITYKSKSLLANTKHLKDIEKALSKDKRYLNLDCMRTERKEMILSYIDKLHSEGPPPPPTASDPSNHKKYVK